MSILGTANNLAGKVKWRSVIAIVLLAAASFAVWKTMPSGFSQVGGIGIRASAAPSSVAPGGSSALEIELQNSNVKGDAQVKVHAETHDKNVYFEDSQNQSYDSGQISIGPQETRKIKLKLMTASQALDGQYSIDFSAEPQGEEKGPQTRLALTIQKST